jgi:hypothetical protein
MEQEVFLPCSQKSAIKLATSHINPTRNLQHYFHKILFNIILL